MRTRHRAALHFLALLICSDLHLFTFSIQVAKAQNVSTGQTVGLDDHRRDVLAHRVERFVSARENALLECASVEKSVVNRYLNVQSLSLHYVHSQNASLENVLLLLQAYGLTENYLADFVRKKSPCAKLIRNADQSVVNEERERFKTSFLLLSLAKFPGEAISPLSLLFMELDPSCDTHPVPDFGSHYLDTNSCTAGFEMVLNVLKDATSNVSPVFEDSAQEIDEWLFEFHTKIRNSKQGQSIDLLRTQFIKQTTPSERLKFLSMLTFLYTAGGSRVGMSTPYGDTFWKSPLRLGLSPEYAYYQYMYWMNRRDAFKSDLEVAQHKNVVLTLGNTNIHSWNHHNMISAFLACDYETRGMNSIAKLVPEALGVAYESKDFVSHLKDGLGWKKSAQNFEQDTDRHRVGAVFGYRYCRYQ